MSASTTSSSAPFSSAPFSSAGAGGESSLSAASAGPPPCSRRSTSATASRVTCSYPSYGVTISTVPDARSSGSHTSVELGATVCRHR